MAGSNAQGHTFYATPGIVLWGSYWTHLPRLTLTLPYTSPAPDAVSARKHTLRYPIHKYTFVGSALLACCLCLVVCKSISLNEQHRKWRSRISRENNHIILAQVELIYDSI